MTGLPPIFIQCGVHNLNVKLSCEERYKHSINITASQHNITANEILVKYSDRLIWLIICYSLQNVICFKHQNQVSCCCEPISYSNKPHVSYVEIKCQLDATEVFIAHLNCLLSMFRASLCPSSGAQEYHTVVAAFGISCCKNVKIILWVFVEW